MELNMSKCIRYEYVGIFFITKIMIIRKEMQIIVLFMQCWSKIYWPTYHGDKQHQLAAHRHSTWCYLKRPFNIHQRTVWTSTMTNCGMQTMVARVRPSLCHLQEKFSKSSPNKMAAILLKSSIQHLSMLHMDCYHVIIGIKPCHQKLVLSISPRESVWAAVFPLGYRLGEIPQPPQTDSFRLIDNTSFWWQGLIP